MFAVHFDQVRHGRANKDYQNPVRSFERTFLANSLRQSAGEEGFRMVAEHDAKGIVPGSEVIRNFMPGNRPCLILMGELMNYASRNGKSGLRAQLFNFLQNVSEQARGNDKTALVVSIPASELEMTAEDRSDYERFKKFLDRVGKAIVMSAESETSEIIRKHRGRCVSERSESY